MSNERGVITDENDVILAENKPTYKAFITAYDKKEFNEILERLNKIIPIKDFPVYRRRSYILVYPSLSWKQVALLESNNLLGVKIEASYKRVYKFPEIFSSVLGYVSIANEKDELNNISDLYLGRGLGVEAYYDEDLMGVPYQMEEEVDAKGRFIRNLDKHLGQKGKNIKTTLDIKLQTHLLKCLREKDVKSAGVVVMDIHTGAIKALISYPTFNPNVFAHSISSKDWNALQKNPFNPLYNKVVQGLYSPGSIFKLTILLTALEKGIRLDDVVCRGHTNIKGQKYHCWTWRSGGHGPISMERAFAESCDIYFYELAQKISLYEFNKTAEKLGFGNITHLDMLYEKKGRLLSFFECFREDPCNYVIGQGKLLSTPLQLATTTAALVNGGYRITPHINQEAIFQKEHLNFDEKHLKKLCHLMSDVTTKGTARDCAFYTKDGLGMAGKTSTVQVCKIHSHERKRGDIDRDYHLKDHKIFVGYGPVKDPKYVVVVIAEHAGKSRVAVELSKDALEFLLVGPSS